MACKTSAYAWMLLVVVSASSLAGVVADTNVVPSIFCAATPEPDFCEAMVNGAKTALMATYRAIKLTMHETKRVHIAIRKFIRTFPKDLPPALKDTVIATCNKDYQQVLTNYMSATEYLDFGEYDKLNATLSTLPMEKCLREIGDIVINPGVADRAIAKLKKYAEYTKMIAQNVMPEQP